MRRIGSLRLAVMCFLAVLAPSAACSHDTEVFGAPVELSDGTGATAVNVEVVLSPFQIVIRNAAGEEVLRTWAAATPIPTAVPRARVTTRSTT